MQEGQEASEAHRRRQPGGRLWRGVARGFMRGIVPASDAEPGPLGRVRARFLVALVFRFMPLQLDRERARGTTASFEWHVALGGEGVLRRTLVIEEGRARVRRRPLADPDVRIEVSAADFLRLAAGTASGPELFFGGRLRVSGNFALALELPRLLRPPR